MKSLRLSHVDSKDRGRQLEEGARRRLGSDSRKRKSFGTPSHLLAPARWIRLSVFTRVNIGRMLFGLSGIRRDDDNVRTTNHSSV